MKKECKTNHNYTVKTKHTHNSSTPGFVQTPTNLINYNLQFINYKLLFDDNAAATQSAVCFIFFFILSDTGFGATATIISISMQILHFTLIQMRFLSQNDYTRIILYTIKMIDAEFHG